MMNDVAASVILYHTDVESFFHHISTYLPFAGHLFVVDNSPEVNEAISQKLETISDRIVYIRNPENLGIAAALNIAAAHASAKGYAWLLTMDQDSFFAKDALQNYLAKFHETCYHATDVAMVAPVHSDHPDSLTQPAFSEVLSVITSGSLLNLRVFETLGRFDEKLFIDEVDHEYGYRAVSRGYRIILFNHIQLHHHLGQKSHSGYFGVIKKSLRTVHNPVRVYFMVRNYLYVRKKYKALFPDEFKRRDKHMRVMIKNNLLFSGRFLANARSIIRGYRDFRRNNFNAAI